MKKETKRRKKGANVKDVQDVQQARRVRLDEQAGVRFYCFFHKNNIFKRYILELSTEI